jgi:hypothetical protein
MNFLQPKQRLRGFEKSSYAISNENKLLNHQTAPYTFRCQILIGLGLSGFP